MPDNDVTDCLFPRPRRVKNRPGVLSLSKPLRAVAATRHPEERAAIRRLKKRTTAGGNRRITSTTAAESANLLVRLCDDDHYLPEAYSLAVTSGEIRLEAGDENGLRYGVDALARLLNTAGRELRAMQIDDSPDFKRRGVMLDISRDKVPKLSTLKSLIEKLADWRINEVQLYIEHTFAYVGHEAVWRGASPMTPAQISALDHFCRDRGIDLVPNQNSLGHMERWLKHPAYRDLAECDGPWTSPWGEVRTEPTTLNPIDPRSPRLMADLYRQLLPNFTSRLFNVGCDEPWELGQGKSASACRQRGAGRVYLDYLLKLHRLVQRHKRRMMFWNDWIQNHPELIGELSPDMIPMVWGYEANHPFERHCRKVAQTGLDFYVCPGTSSWCSIAGRTTNCVTNLQRAAASGLRHGASGYLITDWGDAGHRQYLPVSYPGLLFGAAVSWCGRTNRKLDLANLLSREAFGDPTGVAGQLWLEAGKVHELSPLQISNRSTLFESLDASLSNAPKLTPLKLRHVTQMKARIEKLKSLAGRARYRDETSLLKQEFETTLSVLDHACDRARIRINPRGRSNPNRSKLARNLRRIMGKHEMLWRARNRPGGLSSSLSHYQKILRDYT